MNGAFLDMDITYVISLLDKLSPERKGNWGSMSAQHMVEHLTDSIKISSGKIHLQLEIPEEKIAHMQDILASEREMPKNIEVPFATREQLLRNEELALAIDELLLEWIDFEDFFSEKPDSTQSHPYYGPLNYKQWIRLHSKHFTHHFSQFGLI
jgi:hypothetical protein